MYKIMTYLTYLTLSLSSSNLNLFFIHHRSYHLQKIQILGTLAQLEIRSLKTQFYW